jgi:spermidine synthase
MNVSAVEIDPVVHQFAEDYFGLPKLKGTVAHEDGRAFIERSVEEREKWDYIVHDVFTGGSVPGHLFTTEMWASMKAVLAENGVLAVVCVHGNVADVEYGWFFGRCFNQGGYINVIVRVRLLSWRQRSA